MRAVGQVGPIFTFLASIFLFHEIANRKEVPGILPVAADIVILILTR